MSIPAIRERQEHTVARDASAFMNGLAQHPDLQARLLSYLSFPRAAIEYPSLVKIMESHPHLNPESKLYISNILITLPPFISFSDHQIDKMCSACAITNEYMQRRMIKLDVAADVVPEVLERISQLRGKHLSVLKDTLGQEDPAYSSYDTRINRKFMEMYTYLSNYQPENLRNFIEHLRSYARISDLNEQSDLNAALDSREHRADNEYWSEFQEVITQFADWLEFIFADEITTPKTNVLT